MEDIFSKFTLDDFNKDDSEGFVRITEFEGDFTEMLKGQKEGDMPVLVTRNMVNFPLILASITIARSTTRQLIKYLEKQLSDDEDVRFTELPSGGHTLPVSVVVDAVREVLE